MAEIVFDSAIFIGFRIYLVNGVQIVFRLRVLVGVDKPVALAFISELIRCGGLNPSSVFPLLFLNGWFSSLKSGQQHLPSRRVFN